MSRSKILTIFLTFVLSTQVMAIEKWANRGGLIDSSENWKRKRTWRQLAKSDRDALNEIFRIVETSKQGQALLARARVKARKENKSLLDVVTAGDVSVTDTTLIRKFSSSSPFDVNYHAKSIVILDRGHNVKNAVLDLVHELTHYTFKVPFNPYKNRFTINSFLKDTIEGRGGEVDAFLVECKIGKEIFGRSEISPQCMSIIDSKGEFSRDLAIAEFYKLGSFFDKFVAMAKNNHLRLEKFRYLSRDHGLLISSAWGSPYPLAIIREYTTIMGKVCENDRKRLSYYGKTGGRLPASEYLSFKKMKKEITVRCRDFL
ncbi:hypothetical protein [Bacteriovorax sp. DB6_IX]|uniref:hypothetical protein n=1 Tax=Bacteriovorax sp. DB6_IX TaxID=1353530 RepID=UPI00038A22FC|nr:hypothetical protein [Bacteriovorax sp. DB6_IX]EQC50792.1 hypothetical protein M901_0874 [Bacteriovorax sp. DB6_IX]